MAPLRAPRANLLHADWQVGGARTRMQVPSATALRYPSRPSILPNCTKSAGEGSEPASASSFRDGHTQRRATLLANAWLAFDWLLEIKTPAPFPTVTTKMRTAGNDFHAASWTKRMRLSGRRISCSDSTSGTT